MRNCFFPAALLLLLASFAAPLRAQPVLSVDELRTDFDSRYKNEEVMIKGWVSAERRVVSTSFKGYYIKDRYGSLILVRTTRALPSINAELTVTGVALKDADSGDVYLAETNRIGGHQVPRAVPEASSPQWGTRAKADTRLAQLKVSIPTALASREWGRAEGEIAELVSLAPEEPQVPVWRKQLAEGRERDQKIQELRSATAAAVGSGNWQAAESLIGQLLLLAPGDGQGLAWQQEVAARRRDEAAKAQLRKYLMIGGIGLAVFLMGGGLWLMTRRGETQAAPAPAAAVPAAAAAVPSVPAGGTVVNRTMTLTSVDDYKTVRVHKTTKVMPGTLVVMEEGRETDVLHLYDQSGRGEVEIGRDSPDASGGIRIKDKTNTVSRRQATLSYASGEFKLANLASASSNPTVFNGREMSEKQEVTLKDGDTLVMGAVTLKFRKK